MRAINAQFFLSFAVLGSIGPYLSVLLKEDKGFSETQIGYLTAVASIAMVLSPVVVTLLADTRFDARRLLALGYLMSAAALSLFGMAQGALLLVSLFVCHCMAFMPMVPLQDGFYFSRERQGGGEIREGGDYHITRSWGTAGYLAPSIALYFALMVWPATIVVYSAAIFGIIGLINSFFLPQVQLLDTKAQRALPSLDALKVLAGPKARWFCLALFVAYMASTVYYAFIGLYAKEVVGIPMNQIGLILGIGVFIEIIYLRWMDKMRSWLGLRNLLLVGFGAMVLRLTLLSFFPITPVVYATQILHGLEVIAIFVAPVIYFDRLAGDGFRNSIQGVFTMTIHAGSRIVGSLVGSRIAEIDLVLAFKFCAGLALVAFLITAFLFHPVRGERAATS